MLKVAENLKCKYHRCRGFFSYCVLTGILCNKKCESFVDKYKEWEDARASRLSEKNN